MAAQQVLFKIACPSCDAAVPIRDSGLIGKKVECPKCKYRFVVEEPADDMGDDEPKVKKAKPKKKAANNTLLIGLGVGGVAIAVLAVVAYFMFFKEAEKPKPSNPNPTPIALNSNNNQDRKDAGATPSANADAPKTDAPATPPANVDANAGRGAALPIPDAGTFGDISNLLPNDAQLVVNMNMDKLRFSTLGEQLFESKIGFRPGIFKEKLGFAVEDILRLIHAENPEQKWTFNVYRLNKPLDLKAMERAMGFKKGASSPIKGREYFEIPPNEVLDRIADGLKTELEAAGSRMRKADDQSQTMALAVLDQSTMVIANIDQVKEFLQQDAKPRHQSKPAKPINDQDGGGGGAAGGDGPRPRGGRSFTYSLAPDPLMPQPPANPDDPNLVELASYLTIDPPLKAMFDRLESDQKNLPILTVVMHMQADPKLRDRLRSWTGIPLLGSLPIKVFGIIVNKYELEKAYGTIGAEFFNENDVKEIEAILKKQLPLMATALGLYLGGIRIETEGADAVQTPGAGGSGGGPGGRPASPGGGGQPPDRPNVGQLPGFIPIEDGPTSKLKLSRRSHYLFVSAELNLVQRAYDRIYAWTEGTVAKMRGMVDMSARTPNWEMLTNAAMKLREGGTIPKATYQLAENTGGRLARNWPPHYRVSWMAGLLPYLNSDELYRNIDRDKPWRSEKNLKAAAILIPTFLDPRYPDQSWYARLDALGNRTLGATHYVGMAGVGTDAADYNPATEKDEKRKAEMLKRIGAFGYDRTTAIKDVTDGVANTIYMISVPPTHQRPWISGGGATAQGAPESRSVRPFVHNHGGKKGTYVLMLDGTVRFIKEDISDDVFKALCTIRGGEKIDDINAIAAKVKPGEASLTTKDKEKEDEEKDKP